MPKRLPVRLGKVPLIEAICQILVSSEIPLHAFFPGFLLANCKGDVSEIRQLPFATVPMELRESRPEFANVPVIRLRYKSAVVTIGSSSVNVTCPRPYIGWVEFKPHVLEIFRALLNSGQVSEVTRHSQKYANVLESEERNGALAMLDWHVRVGELPLDLPKTNLRTEWKEGEYTTIITINGSVSAQPQGQAPVLGTLVDVDTISLKPPQAVNDFLSSLANDLEVAHELNKRAFFDCLTDEAINGLDPTYD